MNTLYEIIKSLQSAQGNIAKQAILDANKDNKLFKAFMRATYDVGINYYQKKAPKPTKQGDAEFGGFQLAILQCALAERGATGKDAKLNLQEVMDQSTPEAQELVSLIIDRSIGANVGDTMVLKTWPDLYFLPPYQRCSLMDEKAQERFSKLPEFYVQTKADGSFAYVVKRLDGSVDVITRQGSKYPQWFAEQMADGLEPGKVLVGELLVYVSVPRGGSSGPKLLDRKTGNGLLNSVLKNGELEEEYNVEMQAWDMLTQEEFEAGSSDRPYRQRLEDFKISGYTSLAPHVSIIPTWTVKTLKEADAIYREHLKRGLEGCIAKNPDALWKDGTSKDMVKMKLKFEVEMRCTDVYEGTGKAKGMLGGINMESEDGLLENDCGSGFSDDQRKHFWAHPEEIIGHVIATEANDITQDRDTRKKPSLSLPIFVEVRNDKTKADTYAEIVAQLEAAKSGA
jgi:DNA ligase-1